MTASRPTRLLAIVAVTLTVLGVDLASPVIQSGDGRLVPYEAQSMLTDARGALDGLAALWHLLHFNLLVSARRSRG